MMRPLAILYAALLYGFIFLPVAVLVLCAGISVAVVCCGLSVIGVTLENVTVAAKEVGRE